MKKVEQPVIFWHSDPVGPDETIVLAGGNFSSDAVVELSALSGEPKAKTKWTSVKPLQATESSLKAVIPSGWASGIYACRVRCGENISKTVGVNAPDVWWKQGDEGIDRARSGGWLRILGKCLSLDGGATVALRSERDLRSILKLDLEDVSCYSLKVKIPLDLEPGRYAVIVGNGSAGKEGLCEAGCLEILPAKKEPETVLSVLEFGADPTGMKDCTLAIVQATERLSSLGGGVIYFPRGRYRIDSILRSGTWIASPLFIPEGITLRGDGPDLSSLWWPDREEPLPTLIDGRNDFSVEELAIYTQGRHSTIITGSSNVRIRNVMIRANCYYMTNNNGGTHHNRKIDPPGATGSAFLLWGENNQVTDCDIFNSTVCFDLRVGHGSLIANNKVRAANMQFINGCSDMIFENNEFSGNNLTAGGSNIALHFGATASRHVYYAFNKTSHVYGGDHEALTLDGHGSAYLGRVADIKGASLRLTGKLQRKELNDFAVMIVDGRGAGQYRMVKSYEGARLELQREWDIAPDASSLISVCGFNGRHLIIGNTVSDAGPIQLYPPNCECIVAGNRTIRSSNINSFGKLKRGALNEPDFIFVEPSWYNQFLDNEVVAGNAWGGGRTMVDRWQGGECRLDIWGWQVCFADAGNPNVNRFMTPEDLQVMTGEAELRARSFPSSIFQIVRRHKINNNSSIKVHGAVADVLIEGCDLKKSERGIRIEEEIFFKHPPELGQLFEFDPEPGPENPNLPFLSPAGVLLRNNHFENVQMPYSGTALDKALLLTGNSNSKKRKVVIKNKSMRNHTDV